MFTGALPRSLGLGQAPGGSPTGCRPVIEAQQARLLPEVLRRAGFHTAGVSANLWIADYSGFATGFDEFVSVRTNRTGRLDDRSLKGRLGLAMEALLAHADDGATEADAVVDRWLEQTSTKPFFWFVNLMECHSPYMPPRPYNDLSPIQRLRAARDASRHLTIDAIWRANAGGIAVPEDALARMRHLYRRSIRSLDDWVGRLLEKLERAKALDDTLVLVTSDHGENLGEAGRIGHAFSLDERLVRVPLVARGPGLDLSDGVMGLAELPRFIARSVDLVEHPWAESGGAGVAVSQLDALVEADDPRASEAVERWGLGQSAPALRRLTRSLTAATDGRWKLVTDGRDESLFDLSADDAEAAPVDPSLVNPASLERLRGAVGGAMATVSVPVDVNVSVDEVDGLAEQMRLLGYL
jgi:hypothetical protein